ncbi:MAG: hypothetical protein ACXQTI_03585 [Candidatus Nezhaarchaeales archaeon]
MRKKVLIGPNNILGIDLDDPKVVARLRKLRSEIEGEGSIESRENMRFVEGNGFVGYRSGYRKIRELLKPETLRILAQLTEGPKYVRQLFGIFDSSKAKSTSETVYLLRRLERLGIIKRYWGRVPGTNIPCFYNELTGKGVRLIELLEEIEAILRGDS